VIEQLTCITQKPVEFDQAISYVNKIKVHLITDQLTIQLQNSLQVLPTAAVALHSQQRWRASR